MIGIIGYGFVGKALEGGFPNTDKIISDPKYNNITIEQVVAADPAVIFVCVPTPTDDTEYSLLKQVLQEIKDSAYRGITAVKSTVLPRHLDEFDIVYNPEFLSRATADTDFINPVILLLGGDRANELLDYYRQHSILHPQRVFVTDIKTASLAKYAFNSFYATKVTFMNQIYDVAQSVGVDFNKLTDILSAHPWMGTHHFQVPGPDGERGFGGPCLPKDTAALVSEYDVELLKAVLDINRGYGR
jgi:nucleotide sugar dehydrogenase